MNANIPITKKASLRFNACWYANASSPIAKACFVMENEKKQTKESNLKRATKIGGPNGRLEKDFFHYIYRVAILYTYTK